MNLIRLSSRLTALTLVIAMLHTSTTFAIGATHDAVGMKLTAEVSVSGLAKIDGEEAISGQTLFSGSMIETTQKATAIVNLSLGGRLKLLKSSRLKLIFDESQIIGFLDTGSAHVSVPAGLTANLTTKDATVIADQSQPTIFSVEYKDGDLIVAVMLGRVEIQKNGRSQQIGAGQFTFVEDTLKPQSNNKKGSSDRKLLAILLTIGGALAVVAIIFAAGNNDPQIPEGGCVQILSPTGDNRCP
jgi:hypothetical protein